MMKRIITGVLTLIFLFSAAGVFAEGLSFEQFAEVDWSFSSGAGGWSTDMRIFRDGTFIGEYHDGELGDWDEAYPNGTVYVSRFSGQMALEKQIDEHSWEIRIDMLTLEDISGETNVVDGTRYITTEPYGISENDRMRLYVPGTPVDELTEEMQMWAHLYNMDERETELAGWFLYSEKNESGFVGGISDEEHFVNPWAEVTMRQFYRLSGVSFDVPKGAENVVYRWLDSERLGEMQFVLDGDEFCARVHPEVLRDGELANISDMYFMWENEEAVKIRHCDGTIGTAKTGSTEWVELCLWYDKVPGLMYSLSVYTLEPDGLDLTAVAEMIFNPVQELL